MKKIFFITELIILGWFVYFILLGIDYAVSGSMNTNNIFFDFLGGYVAFQLFLGDKLCWLIHGYHTLLLMLIFLSVKIVGTDKKILHIALVFLLITNIISYYVIVFFLKLLLESIFIKL
ncbi:hypothetical protein [Treponema denticola]|uniref:hypothetical protein n=1 Tax=Treponema denticola TaxID=158 RepID=UPI0001FD3B05|nr:hypothetical protein [Treponema denticola]EGC77700.1 hypothetical protein HMPREF9353_01279 [Treponema denticola F0402]